MALRIAALAALLAATRLAAADPEEAVAEAEEALAEDDHCQSTDETCAVNALQARARKVAAAANATAGFAPGTCASRCGAHYDRAQSCQCNSHCWGHDNCCADFKTLCSHGQAPSPSNDACYKTGKTYELAWKAQGKSFFDDWTFVTEDMVHGAQAYTTRSEAEAQGIIGTDSHSARLGVGGIRSPSRPGEAYKRYAAHIRSNKAFDPKNSMVVAMKYSSVPTGCGVWPGFWTVNSDVLWPEGGELDIMEYQNHEFSKVSFHAAEHCRLDTHRISQCLPKNSHGPGPSDCFTSYFHAAYGCRPRQHQRTGDDYMRIPGVIAAQWTIDTVTVYLFPEGQIPQDLADDKPTPDNWSSEYVVAFLPFKFACTSLRPQEIVLNVQLCGDAAGGPWMKTNCARKTYMQSMMGRCTAGLSQPFDCCTQYVTSPGMDAEIKATMNFNVSYIKVFTPDGKGGVPSGTYQRGGVGLTA